MTYFDLPVLVWNIWGAFIGFLYLISSNADTVEKRKNFYISIWDAIKGFCVSLATSGAICEILIRTEFFNDLFFSPYMRAAIGFLIAVRHKQVVGYLFNKIFKSNKIKNETD